MNSASPNHPAVCLPAVTEEQDTRSWPAKSSVGLQPRPGGAVPTPRAQAALSRGPGPLKSTGKCHGHTIESGARSQRKTAPSENAVALLFKAGLCFAKNSEVFRFSAAVLEVHHVVCKISSAQLPQPQHPTLGTPGCCHTYSSGGTGGSRHDPGPVSR